MAAVNTRAGGVGVADAGARYVLAVSQRASVAVNSKDGLRHGVEQVDVFARLAIELPEDAVFTDRE